MNIKAIKRILSILVATVLISNSVLPSVAMETTGEQGAASSRADTTEDYTLPNEEEYTESITAKETLPIFEDGLILIYNYHQLTLIGSGKNVTDLDPYEDRIATGSVVYDKEKPVTYSLDGNYQLAQDIALPRHTQWSLPDGFTGRICGSDDTDRKLYDNAADTIYLYNPYQLAVTAMDDAEDQPVLSGDIRAETFGTGKPVASDDEMILTYSGSHNYVISSQFMSDVSEIPVSVAKKNVPDRSGAGNQFEGRDFAGQVIKEINGETYILIGNESQLRAIGSDEEVYTPVYEVALIGTAYRPVTDAVGSDIILYGGDADLTQTQNGYNDFAFHEIKTKTGNLHYYAGVDQTTGQPYSDATHTTLTLSQLNAAQFSWRTGEKYTINSNYIIFRDIDLGGDSSPWTPLMFTGNMYGIKSVGGSELWNGSTITDATDLADRTASNRPVISNVYIDQSAPIEVNKYIGIGFFATVTNEVNTANIGVSAGTVHVENIELNVVEVHNTSVTAKQAQTILNALTSSLGWLVGGLVDLLVNALSFGAVDMSLNETLSNLLNARVNDPTIYATGGFAGRVIGDVSIKGCAVTGSVIIENHKDNTGGFIGYSDGVTQYDGLSQVLDVTVNALASLLNAIPGLGLGDLITILLGSDNTLPLGDLIPTGYLTPEVSDCFVDGLSGQLGQSDTNKCGGFFGAQIGTKAIGCTVQNSSYTVKAESYGGGFSGVSHDGEIKGTLSDLGIDLIDENGSPIVANIQRTISRFNDNLDLIGNFQTESLLQNCNILNSNVTVDGGDHLGGFSGALVASYAIDCDIKGRSDQSLTITGTGSSIGGFAGTATIGWLGSLENSQTAGNNSLLSAVRQVGTGLLSSQNSSQSQKLLSLVGLVPSAAMGIQIDTGEVTVHGGGSYIGGIIGKGQGILLTPSTKENLNRLTFWEQNNITEKTPRDNYLINLAAVTAGGDSVGGIVGQLETVSIAGVLDGALTAGMYTSFEINNVTIDGINGGYIVTTDGTESSTVNGNYAAGGFGRAYGGTIENVTLNDLKMVEAANNAAAGFIGGAGPGEVVDSNGLTINLLGLNQVLQIKDLLSLGQHIHVSIKDSNVVGITSGFTVEALGSGSLNGAYKYTASGFIAQSNSTETDNCHTENLLFVKAAAVQGCAGGFIGTSETGALADMAGDDGESITQLFSFDSNHSLISIDGLVNAVSYLIPKYTNCTTTFVDGGYVEADIAGGFAADMESGTVDNSGIASVDDTNNPKWTKRMKQVYDPEAINPTGDTDKQFAVFNIDHVKGYTYGGGFAGKLRSGSLAGAGKGVSVLGDLKIPGTNQKLTLSLNDLINIINTYIPYVIHAGVYSENGFTVSANTVPTGSVDPNAGSAGGFAGYMSGAQVSCCDVYKLKNTAVTPPEDLDGDDASAYFDSAYSAYAVTGGHYAGGYVGNADIGDAASVGGSVGVLELLNLKNILSALSVVVTTIEHSDVQGAAGGFSVIADATDINGKVGAAGGFAGGVCGAHIQNSHCKNFYYIIGREAAGGYVGRMSPGDTADLMDDVSILGTLVSVSDSLASVAKLFLPTIRNSTTSCVPCGGAVRAQAASDNDFQRGCAGGYCGHSEGGQIWGFSTDTWEDQNDGVIGHVDFGHQREGHYTGEQHRCFADRIRSVYGYEYAGGFTGLIENASTAETGNISLLGSLINVSNILNALKAIYSTQRHTSVTGPLRDLDYNTWNSWVEYIGKNGGYGAELARNGTVENQAQLNAKLSKYIYGFNVTAGRSFDARAQGSSVKTEGADAGGYVGLMISGVITDGQSYDAMNIRALRCAGGFAGSMQTGGSADFGSVSIFNTLSLSLSDLVSLADVFVPAVKSSSVHGYQSGMTVISTGSEIEHQCGYAGGYAGSVYGGQIWGSSNDSGYTPTGCMVYNLRYVRGSNSVGGFVGLASAAGVANANTNISGGFLQGVLDTVISNAGDIADVLDAGITTIYDAGVSADSAEFGFSIEGTNGSLPQYAGGFGGLLEAAVVGDINGESTVSVTGLRRVDAEYYAGGFFGLSDVTGVANVSEAGVTNILGRTLAVSEIGAIDAFRTYIYHSEVTGASDGIIVRANSESTLGGSRYTGCAGGFGGAMMNGTVKHGSVSNLNTVQGRNYVGGFIGHMGKSGVVEAENARVIDLLGLGTGVFDIFATHIDDCEVTGCDSGAVIIAQDGQQPIAGGFAGYADISKIKNSKTEKLKQVYSDQISGGFCGKTDMNYLINVNADSPLVQAVLGILNLLLRGLLINQLENIDLASLNLGIVGLNVLTDGQLVYVNLLGLKVGVTILDKSVDGQTGTVLVTIGDSSVALPFNENGIDVSGENSELIVHLIKGSRTRIENCAAKGIAAGYDVYAGGAYNDTDGSGSDGYAGGFVGYNNEGKLLGNKMEYCDVVRGTPQKVGPFSGVSSLQSVYSFNTLASIEGENNTYSVYRTADPSLAFALTSDNVQIGSSAVQDSSTPITYNRYDISHLAQPITPSENEPYYKIFEKWEDAVIASNTSGANAAQINVYESSAKAVLMLDVYTKRNDSSMIPEPVHSQDPCDLIDLTIQKVWDDLDDIDGSRPSSIYVRIRQWQTDAQGNKINGTDSIYISADNIPDIDITDGWFALTEAANSISDASVWKRVVGKLPVSVTQGSETIYYAYTVEEQAVVGYTTQITYSEDGFTATVTNKHRPILPVTGGLGDIPYTVIGVSVLLISVVGFKRKKTHEKQSDGDKSHPPRSAAAP